MPAAPVEPAPLYQIKITLLEIKPPVWRRFVVPGNVSLRKLHSIVQAVMPWDDGHLHEWSQGKHPNEIRWGTRDEMNRDDPPRPETAKLNAILTEPKQILKYWYDFGDDWWHELRLEKILPPDPHLKQPICLAGARACPPDDCGGPWGYMEMLENLAGEGEERDELVEWLGGEWDPEEFDLEELNGRLKKIKV